MSQCHTGSQWKLWRKKTASFLPKTQINRLWLPTLNQVKHGTQKIAASAAPKSYSQLQHFRSPPWKFAELPRPRVGLGQLDGSKSLKRFGWFSPQKHRNFHVYNSSYVLTPMFYIFSKCCFCCMCVFESQKPRLPQVWAIGWCSRSSSSLGLAKESSRGPGWRHFQDKIEVKVQEDSLKYVNK